MNPLKLFQLVLAAIAIAVGVFSFNLLPDGTLPAIVLLAAAGLAMAFNLADTQTKVTKALPNGAATVASDGIDLGLSTRSNFAAQVELVINAPALATGDLGDADTMIYDVYHDDAAGFGTESLLFDNVITQTGAGGAGAAAVEKRLKLPSNVKRYIRVKATNSDAGDASDKSFTAQLKF